MIPRNRAPGQASPQSDCPPESGGTVTSWQIEMQDAIRDPVELWQILRLPPELLAAAERAARAFPLRVPRAFVARMQAGDPLDPLLRQVIPLDAETQDVDGFVEDPVGDARAVRSPGVIHKYQGRVLLIATGACAVHCRYCFRREFPYSEQGALGTAWPATRDYLTHHTDVQEVILSGGDPAMLSDARLTEIVTDLATLPHVHTLRLHTRLPVVLPSRVTEGFLYALTRSRLKPVVVIHSNHAREIDRDVAASLKRMSDAGVRLFNQAVLLRGVNDRVDVLAELSQRVFDAGVTPYYLHLLDRVRGAAHFEVDEPTARALHLALEARLPGYLVPRLVREIPGEPAKVRIR